VRGPAHALEGEKGFYAAMCPDPDPDALTRDGGPAWQIHATSFKPWAACRHAHPAIDAALAVRSAWLTQAGARPWSQVQSITIATYEDAVAFCDRTQPTTVDEARFSLQHAVAVSLLQGSPAPAAFEPATIALAPVAALRAVTQAQVDAAIESRYPAHFSATVTVHWHDGTSLSHTALDTLGDPEKPLAPAALRDIVEASLAAAGWPDEQSRARLAHTCALVDDTSGAWRTGLPVMKARAHD